jgi:NAD(P)H-flavin reductase
MERIELTLEWSKQETTDIKLLSMIPSKTCDFVLGQIVILGMEGVGESYFAIASPPEEKETLEFLIKKGSSMSTALFSAASRH